MANDAQRNEAVPNIKKAKLIAGHSILLRDADIPDAEFILALRTDHKKSRFISVTPPEIEAQRRWLANYRIATDTAYFVICDTMHKPLGTVKLYDPKGLSFCWGGWIIADEAPSRAAIESALAVYTYALDFLGFRNSHFDVNKENAKVIAFHERFGAIRYEETDRAYLFKIDESVIRSSLAKYARFLPHGIQVEFYGT